MGKKKEQDVFIRQYVKTGDHIAAYLKAFPNVDRKTAAPNGKRWLKNAAIAAEIQQLSALKVHDRPETDEILQPSLQDSADLSPKQKRFCEEYMIDLNATQAAIRAGYSEQSAYQLGYNQLSKVEVQAYIQHLQVEKSRRVEITAYNVLRELGFIGFARITDYLKVEQKEEEYQEIKPKKGKKRKTDDFDEEDENEEQDPETEPKKVVYKVVNIFVTDKLSPDLARAIHSIKQGAAGIELKSCV